MNAPSERVQEPIEGEARFSLIWLHGLGATADDFDGLGEHFQCPGLRVIALQAPTLSLTLFEGQSVPAWFDIQPQEDGTIISDPEGLEQTAARIFETILQQREAGIESFVIGGYSQGGAMALYAALNCPTPLAGAVCLSGYLPQADSLLKVAAKPIPRIPLFLAHGNQDEVDAAKFGAFGRDQLMELGYPVQWYSEDFGHQVTAEELQQLGTFLRRTFGVGVSGN